MILFVTEIFSSKELEEEQNYLKENNHRSSKSIIGNEIHCLTIE